jgi:hypothetical protein
VSSEAAARTLDEADAELRLEARDAAIQLRLRLAERAPAAAKPPLLTT